MVQVQTLKESNPLVFKRFLEVSLSVEESKRSASGAAGYLYSILVGEDYRVGPIGEARMLVNLLLADRLEVSLFSEQFEEYPLETEEDLISLGEEVYQLFLKKADSVPESEKNLFPSLPEEVKESLDKIMQCSTDISAAFKDLLTVLNDTFFKDEENLTFTEIGLVCFVNNYIFQRGFKPLPKNLISLVFLANTTNFFSVISKFKAVDDYLKYMEYKNPELSLTEKISKVLLILSTVPN